MHGSFGGVVCRRYELKCSPLTSYSNRVEVLQSTRSHLNKHFTKYFEEEEGHDADYFQHLDLSVKQFDVGGTRRRLSSEYSMAILYHGVSFYNSSPVPDKEVVYEIVSESFMGDSRKEFVDAFLDSKDSFLANLQYMVIMINDKVVANEDFAHHVASSNGEETSSSGTSWVLVAAVAGSALGVLVAIAILFYIWRLKRSESFLELPEKYCTQEELDLELKSTQSPSPEKSLISQESSKFTYNPSGGLSSGMSKDSTLPSNFSTGGLQVDSTQPVDVEAWQKNSISPITPAPFGHDISAIEDEVQRDLSMVEECPSSQERSSAESSSASAFNYLSKNSLMSLANIERGSTEPPKRVSPKNMYSMSTDDSNVMSEISLNDDGSDVISDLKNLSVQFQQHRASYR